MTMTNPKPKKGRSLAIHKSFVCEICRMGFLMRARERKARRGGEGNRVRHGFRNAETRIMAR